MASPKTMRAKCFTSHFSCDLSKHITSISPITSRFPAVASGDGRHWQYKVYQPGQPVYGNITFEGVEHKDTIAGVRDWVADVYNGKEIRKDISIDIFDQAGDTVRTFNLINTFPIHYSILDVGAEGSAGTVVKWTLEVRVERVDMQ